MSPVSRRHALASLGSLPVLLACEPLGITANINTSTTVNGKTTARQYEVRNYRVRLRPAK